jgi:hypothetical protein
MASDDNRFHAWLDGELTGDEAAAMEARVAEDPELARLARQHRELRARLHAAFDPVAEEPVPERLTRIIANDKPQVIDLAAVRAGRAQLFQQPVQWLAIAASLAAGIVIGGWWRGEPSPIRQDSGKLYAAASLERSLDTELASASGSGALRVGITFRNHQGAICRTFTEAASAGVACRDGARWRMDGLLGGQGTPSADYRMASGMDPRLADMVGSMIAGEPLNAPQERAARDRRWR